jgi:hypothetical protein
MALKLFLKVVQIMFDCHSSKRKVGGANPTFKAWSPIEHNHFGALLEVRGRLIVHIAGKGCPSALPSAFLSGSAACSTSDCFSRL